MPEKAGDRDVPFERARRWPFLVAIILLLALGATRISWTRVWDYFQTHRRYHWVSEQVCRNGTEDADGEEIHYYDDEGKEWGRVFHCQKGSPWNAFSTGCRWDSLYVDYATREAAVKKIEDWCD